MHQFKKVMCFCFSMVILLSSSVDIVKADSISTLLEPYYEAVEELNVQYNASIQMPSYDKLKNVDEILNMSVGDFKQQIEREYLSVSDFESNQYIINTNESFIDITSICSSGRKNQNCYIYNSNMTIIGRLYLTADVVEAGVNQYTAIREYGYSIVTGDQVYFSVINKSASLSNNNKTCTVTYSGYFVNLSGIYLTSYITYTVPYQASGGNLSIIQGVSL